MGKPSCMITITGSVGSRLSLIHFFQHAHLPEACYVVLPHVPAHLDMQLRSLMAKRNDLLIREIRAGLVPSGDRIYLMPNPDVVDIERGFFSVQPAGGQRNTADIFMKSMAKRYGRRSVGIILSGANEEGAEGMAEIYRAGGLTLALAQEADQYRISDTPGSTIKTNLIKHVLSPAEMPAAIHHYIKSLSAGLEESGV